MGKVQLGPAISVVGGGVALALAHVVSPLSPLGWTVGLAYLVASNALVGAGLRRRRAVRFGWGNDATATRSVLVGVISALVATSFTTSISVPLLIGLAAPALALDAVDGWLARRTGTTSELGARFDMEVDAFLLLALSIYVARSLGWWVLAIGLLRYAFVAAGWLLPWMRATLPPRYWRKVVTAVAGIALTIAASGLAPSWMGAGIAGVALALLVESFGRDVVWLWRSRRSAGSRMPRRAWARP
ncbi:CDP-alcohol phosphatidyltransferase family protein [Microbacterium ulmi]|uniref:CDP-alcohol phosphatidyltransferase family protein n=1 Tax=Microbacterium ulmi TaxID=179095 RepID=A0A7Y2M0S0_9MICO|nr:phosphatidylglycerophosphate synthase [Microbacterium ulmi]NNH03889.1 CDP-alcohol phosphatidyltransferase family protein [Microbacterium ulmi]